MTTVLLAVAVPSLWAEKNVVSEDGYAALAATAAKDPQLQEAMASELATQITELAADNGYDLNTELVHGVTAGYTANPGFPGQFAQANRIAHRWMFTDSVQRRRTGDRWLIDIAPMLNDPSLKATLGNLGLDVPQTLRCRSRCRSPRRCGPASCGVVDLGPVGERRRVRADRGVRVADPGYRPFARQSPCGTWCFGAAGRRGGVGGGGGGPAQRQRRAGPHDR